MKKQIDMLSGSLTDKLLLFALPLAATGILQQLFNAADVAVVGRFVSNSAMAAVGSNAPLIGLFVNLFVGISLGANVVISHGIGENNLKKVSNAVHTSVLVALLGGILFSALGEMFIKPIIGLLSVPDDVIGMSTSYLRVYMLGFPLIFLYNFESSIFRSNGDTGTPLIVLSVSGVLNVLLNLYFVLVHGMASEGVALATVISNGVSAAVLFVILLRTDKVIKVEIKKLRIHLDELRQMLIIGIPSGIQGMVFSISNICIQSAINSLGTTVMASSSAAFNLEIFAFYMFNSFGQACTTFTGQNFGARNLERCRSVLKRCLILAAAFELTASSVILLLGRSLLGFFTTDPEVIEVAYIRLIYIFATYVFSLFLEVMSGFLRGFGLSVIPAVTALVGICGTRIIWVYTGFRMFHSFTAIMVIYPISMGITALILWTIYLIKRKSLYNPENF